MNQYLNPLLRPAFSNAYPEPASIMKGVHTEQKDSGSKRASALHTTSWNHSAGHCPLSAFLNHIHPLRAEVLSAIDRGSYPVSLPKRRFLVKPGNTESQYYLVLKGVIRGYVKKEGKEITTWISEENEIVGSIRGLASGVPSEEYIQAIEDTQCIGIPYSLVLDMYDKYPETNIIGRKILEDCYRNAEERAFICRIPSAENRYKRLIATRPQLINRIALKYIASYLGMTLETLSRVRGRQTHSLSFL